MSMVGNLSFIGTATGVFNTDTYDVSKYQHIRLTLFCASNCDITFNWSMNNGIDTDLTETYSTTAGNTVTHSISVKTKYLYLTYTPAATPAALRSSVLFFEEPASVSELVNTGTGAEILKVSEHAIRTVKSSDLSVSVTQDPNEIDLTVTIPPSVTLSATQSMVSVGTAPNYTLSVGPVPSLLGSFALTNKTTAYPSGQFFTYMGHDTALNATGTQNTFYGYACGIATTGNYNTLMGVAAGRNILSGSYNTCLGYNSAYSVGQLTGNFNTAVGTYAGGGIKDGCASNSHFGSQCGYQSPENSSVNRQCCFGSYAGYQCSASDIVNIGWNSLNGATTQGNYSVSFGSGCAQNTTAGSLNFGASMEAIATTATAGIRILPATPAGFIPITWNGTAYKIPVYLP